MIVLFDPSVAGDTFIARVDGLLSGSVVSSGAGSTRIVGGTITHLAIHLGAPAMCGYGVVVSLVEACDDGNLDAGDGCAADCTIETGWGCSNELGAPSHCDHGCGSGPACAHHHQ